MSKLLTKNKVSSNIFVGTPPATLNDCADFVVVDVIRSTDYDSHAVASVNIFLYAKPTGNPLKKNVKRLNAMEEALTTAIEGGSANDYSITQIYHDSDYDTNLNYHFNMVNIEIII